MIHNPRLFSPLRRVGIADLVDFREMTAITFKDNVLISQLRMPAESRWLPLLFHELVHVAQYEVLGVRAFVEQYVRGWYENGFDYSAIPLEGQAYDLQGRYELHPSRRFAVATDLQRRFGLKPQGIVSEVR